MRVDGQGSNWLRRSLRLAIYARDGWRCVYCCKKVYTGRGKALESSKWAAQLDHVVAQELGGVTDSRNLVTCCAPCNTLKGSKSLAVFASDLKLFRRKDFRQGMAARIRSALRSPVDRAEGLKLFRKGL